MPELNIITDQRAVTAAATPERINEETNENAAKVISIIIRANTGNAGVIYVAGPQQKATITTDGYILSPGETLTLDVSQIYDAYLNLQKIWIDAANNGDGITYTAFEVI